MLLAIPKVPDGWSYREDDCCQNEYPDKLLYEV